METASEKEVILLGLIAEDPIHAYGLEEKIRRRSMEDWTTISKSSIYRLLQNLEERFLITGRLEHEGQGATRKVFSLTPGGIEALASGILALIGTTERAKSPFLVGLSFSYFAPRDDVLAQLQQRCEAFREGERSLTGIRDDVRTELEHNPSAEAFGVDTVYDLFFDYLLERSQLEVRFLEAATAKLAEARRSQLELDPTESE
jgi:DNA-binding PadR family transcriptional regulator